MPRTSIAANVEIVFESVFTLCVLLTISLAVSEMLADPTIWPDIPAGAVWLVGLSGSAVLVTMLIGNNREALPANAVRRSPTPGKIFETMFGLWSGVTAICYASVSLRGRRIVDMPQEIVLLMAMLALFVATPGAMMSDEPTFQHRPFRYLLLPKATRNVIELASILLTVVILTCAIGTSVQNGRFSDIPYSSLFLISIAPLAALVKVMTANSSGAPLGRRNPSKRLAYAVAAMSGGSMLAIASAYLHLMLRYGRGPYVPPSYFFIPSMFAIAGVIAYSAPIKKDTEQRETGQQSGKATVFISYNHGDREVADRLKAALETAGIQVRIDKAVMEAGGSIQEFIETSIRETDVTVALVSNRSLLSAWVALESIGTFNAENATNAKKFIACYVDDEFLKPEIRLSATRQIDAKIAEIDAMIPEYNSAKIDTNDLNNQKSRLYKLRNNLGDILERLRESLCLDIREPQFAASMTKLVSAIEGSGNA